MANALGTVSPGNPNTMLVAAPLVDPRHVREERRRYRRPALPELAYANSFYCPAGVWPACGWLLLRREDYNKLDPYSTNLVLQLSDGTTTLTFRNLTVVQAQCVTRGVAADPRAIYLVQVTDGRGVLYSPWFAQPTQSQYNATAPAYPGQYYDASLNVGAPFTWDEMVANLWGQMAARLGAYPGLPTTFTGPPSNWLFPGISAWMALCQILDYQGCQVSADLTLTSGQYSIVNLGSADAAFVALTAKYAHRLEEDLEWIDTGSGRVPSQVTVYFHRQNEFYGTEETVRRDSYQWTSTSYYTVTLPAPAAFTSAAGTGFQWADFKVRYDVDNNPLPADVATAATIAAEQVQQYFASIYRSTLGFMTRVYAGLLPFVTGSQVDGVVWRQDYREGTMAGWRTEIVRGRQPPWPEVACREEYPE